jgi:hypothetical protein
MQCRVLAAVLTGMVWAVSSAAHSSAAEDVDAALRAHFRFTSAQLTPQHALAEIDLDGDGLQDAVVLLTDKEFCGSGGCTLEVFKGTHAGLHFVSGTTLVLPPILVLPTKSHGWRTLITGSRYIGHARLDFNGHRYPVSASLPTKPADLNSALEIINMAAGGRGEKPRT